MGIRLPRGKRRNIVASLIYRLSKLSVVSPTTKLRLFLDLEWIFDRLCHEYSFIHYKPSDHPLRVQTTRAVLDFLQPQHVVLDLGCGTGDLSFKMAEVAKHVTGVDHDARAIAQARRRYQRDNLEFIRDDARAFLRTSPRPFDVLILSHILEHLDDPRGFLEQFEDRVSYVYVEVPDFDKSHLNRYRIDLGRDLIYTDNDHVWEFDRHELADLLRAVRLEILQTEYVFGLQRVWCRMARREPGKSLRV